MTISNLKADDDGSVSFSGTADLSRGPVVFEAWVDPIALAYLVNRALHGGQFAAVDGPVLVKVTGVVVSFTGSSPTARRP